MYSFGWLVCDFAVEDFSEDFGGADDSHAGAVEVAVSVGEDDAAVADGAEIVPAGVGGEGGQIALGAREVVAAGGDDEDFGVGLADLVPIDGAGVLASEAEQDFAVGGIDEFRPPVSEGEDGVCPFEYDDGWSCVGGAALAEAGEAGFFVLDQGAARFGSVEGQGDAFDASENAVEGSGGEGEDWCGMESAAGEVAWGDGADLAVLLSEDEVGVEGLDMGGVEDVKRLPGADASVDLAIDFAAGDGGVEGGLAERGQSGDPWRIVALVGAPDEQFAQAERADDFRGAGKKREDAGTIHGPTISGGGWEAAGIARCESRRGSRSGYSEREKHGTEQNGMGIRNRILDEKRSELEKYEFMMGVERGRLAVALDLLTDALILTGQHGVYCVSNRNPAVPRLDLEAVLGGINGAKELIQSVMASLDAEREQE